MSLAKFGLGLLALLVLVGLAFTVFWSKQTDNSSFTVEQNSKLPLAEHTADDLTYGQEVRTFSARTKSLEEQVNFLIEEQRKKERENEAKIRELENELSNAKESKDKKLVEEIELVKSTNTELKEKTKQLLDELTVMKDKLVSATNKATDNIDIESIEGIISQKIDGLKLNATNEKSEPVAQNANVFDTQPVEKDEVSTVPREPVEPKPERVRLTPYGSSAVVNTGGSEGVGLLDGLAKLNQNVFQSNQSESTEVHQTNSRRRKQRIKKPTIYPVYTLPVTTMLNDATLLTPLIGRVPITGNVEDPFKFQVELGAENLAANGHKIPGIAKVIAAGSVIGNREQSCVRGSINALTFIFKDGRIHTVGDNNAKKVVSGLAYLADPYGKPCIRGEYINNAAQYIQSRGISAFLEGLAAAYGQAQVTRTYDQNGLASQFVNGNSYEFAAAQGLAGTAAEIADYVRQRSIGAFDVIYVPQATKVQLIVEQQINIDYDTKGRKISYLKNNSEANYD